MTDNCLHFNLSLWRVESLAASNLRQKTLNTVRAERGAGGACAASACAGTTTPSVPRAVRRRGAGRGGGERLGAAGGGSWGAAARPVSAGRRGGTRRGPLRGGGREEGEQEERAAARRGARPQPRCPGREAAGPGGFLRVPPLRPSPPRRRCGAPSPGGRQRAAGARGRGRRAPRSDGLARRRGERPAAAPRGAGTVPGGLGGRRGARVPRVSRGAFPPEALRAAPCGEQPPLLPGAPRCWPLRRCRCRRAEQGEPGGARLAPHEAGPVVSVSRAKPRACLCRKIAQNSYSVLPGKRGLP